jgi:hypothetical protein
MMGDLDPEICADGLEEAVDRCHVSVCFVYQLSGIVGEAGCMLVFTVHPQWLNHVTRVFKKWNGCPCAIVK